MDTWTVALGVILHMVVAVVLASDTLVVLVLASDTMMMVVLVVASNTMVVILIALVLRVNNRYQTLLHLDCSHSVALFECYKYQE
jgi:hypothetical protein